MNLSPTLIDEIVRQVMQHLPSTEGAPVATAKATLTPGANGSASTAANVQASISRNVDLSSAIRLDATLITADTLESLPKTTHTLHIAKAAILTPSAHDLVRARRLSIVRADVMTSITTQASAGLCLLDPASPTADSVWQNIVKQAPHWTTESLPNTATTIKRILAAIEDRLAPIIVVSSEPWTIACLANRHADVRACVLTTVQDQPTIARTLNPNVWCIASNQSFLALRTLLRTVASSKLTCHEV